MIYKDGVYDITEFAENHPGGNKILLAAGDSIAPFWALYGAHHTNDVYAMLEGLRIGNLAKADREAAAAAPKDEGPYACEPTRHPALIVRSQRPFNAEPPSTLLVTEFLTPNALFYVRNHLPVPIVDPKTYKLDVIIEGEDGEPIRHISLSLDDLKTKFPIHTITAAMQCSGNRRHEMTVVKSVQGLDWDHMAISNAQWTGVLLRDVLHYAGLEDSQTSYLQHVQFEGLDRDVTAPYGASIPIEKALCSTGDVLLAFKMNGEELPLDHGYPVRVLAPGIVGARCVKWVSKIQASKEESKSHWQQNDYKAFSPSVNWENVDFKSAPAIQAYPVQSAICEPVEGTVIGHGEEEITIKGYAWSGNGQGIIRVDVSCDGGNNWLVADLIQEKPDRYNRSWAWTIWEVRVPVSKLPAGNVELVAKAVDSSYNTQPDTVAPIWNLRGVINNAWHRVHVVVEPPSSSSPPTASSA